MAGDPLRDLDCASRIHVFGDARRTEAVTTNSFQDPACPRPFLNQLQDTPTIQAPLFNRFAAVREICEGMQTTGVSEFKSNLKNLGVSFESPNVRLPLRHVEVPPPSPGYLKLVSRWWRGMTPRKHHFFRRRVSS
jgi:hypothetical protein